MPAKSQAQRALLNAKFGHDWVKKHHYDNKGKLPEHVAKGKTMHKKEHKGHKAHGHKAHGHKAQHEMAGHLDSIAGKDAHAHATHHAENKKHGMDEGMSPGGSYEEGSDKSCLGCNEEHD